MSVESFGIPAVGKGVDKGYHMQCQPALVLLLVGGVPGRPIGPYPSSGGMQTWLVIMAVGLRSRSGWDHTGEWRAAVFVIVGEAHTAGSVMFSHLTCLANLIHGNIVFVSVKLRLSRLILVSRLGSSPISE